MKKILTIVVGIMLTIGLLAPAAVIANGLEEIHVRQETLPQQDDCGNGVILWHFIINGIDTDAHVPASIHVYWDNGANAIITVDPAHDTAPTAHYTTTSNVGAKVTDATADIYSDWDGKFNLSHVVCDGTSGKSGMKFNDVNKNGVKDNNELGLANWTIFVDYNDNGVLDTNEPFAVTDTDGTYFITGIAPGTWKVREVAQNGWTCTLPTTIDAKGPFYEETFVEGSTQTGNDFGNFEEDIGEPPAEVGGEVYPNNTPVVASIFTGFVIVLAGMGILLRRHFLVK